MKKILLFLCAMFFATGAGSTGIGANDTTAPCDNNTLGQTSGTANIEVDWQPNTINIRWYDGDTQLNVQSNAQSCVYDDDLYLPATQPTKTGYTFKGWTVKYAIPAEYTQLEYLKSTGSEYIDSGILFDTRQDFEVKGEVINPDASKRKIILGNYSDRSGDQLSSYSIEFGGVYNNGSYDYSPGAFRNWIQLGAGSEGAQSFFAPSASPTDVLIHYDTFYDSSNHTISNKLIANGVTLSYNVDIIVSQDYEMSRSLRFFLDYRNTTYIVANSISIGISKIYKNGELAGFFIPARRNSDNVLGMYDTVTGTFFTNSGSGSFIAGPAVQ